MKYVCPFCKMRNEISVEHEDELHVVVCSCCDRVFIVSDPNGMEYYCVIELAKVKQCIHGIKNKLTNIHLSTAYLDSTQTNVKQIIKTNVRDIINLLNDICEGESI